MFEFVTRPFDMSGFVPKEQSGDWANNPGLKWLHVGGDLFIGLAYVSIPLVLLYFTRRRDLPHRRVFVLFALFILAAGFGHLIEALLFEYPLYRLAGIWKLLTAVVSWAAVLALIPVVPRVMAAVRSPGASAGQGDTALHRLAAPAPLARANDYIIALLAAVLALLVRAAAEPLVETDRFYVLPLLAVVFVSWQGGFGPAILTLLVSLAGMVYFFLEPSYSFVVVGLSNQLATALYFFVGVCCAGLGEAQRQARRLTKAALSVALERKADLEGEIARRLEFEDALGRSEATLRAFYDSAPVSMGIVEPLADDILHVYDNAASCRFFGVPPDRTAGRRATDLGTPPDILTLWLAKYRHSAKSGDVVRFEYEYAAPDGPRWLSATVSPIGPVGRGRDLFCYIADDVTDRRRADAALRESEARKTSMLESALDCVITIDAAGRVVEFNPAAERTFGYSRAEALGRDMSELLIPDRHRDAHHRGIARYLRTGEGSILNRRLELPALRRDGTEFPAEVSITPITAGSATYFTGYLRDISDRLRAEEAIRRSEKNLSDFFENANVGLLWVGPDGVVLRANKAELEMLGYAPEEYVGLPIADFHADPDAISDILTRLGRGESLDDYAARLRCKDGNVRDVLISSTGLWECGRLVYTRWFTRDVSDLKRAERALAERARLATMRADIGAALDAGGDDTRAALRRCAEILVRETGAAFVRIWTTDPRGEWLDLQASAGLYTHTDGPHGRIQIGEFKIGRIASTARPHLTNDVRNDPNVSDPEWAAREGMVAFAGYPLLVEGRVRGVMALFAREPLSATITADLAPVAEGLAQYLERRRADIAIRASEERFRTLTEAIPQIVWNAGPDGEASYFNRRWLDYTGLPVDQARGRGWLDAVHPDDRDAASAAWQATVEAAAAGVADRFTRELRLRRVDEYGDEYRWFLTVAVPLRRPDGTIDQWIGSMADIHDQKTVSAVIAESEEKFRTMAESIPQLAWMTDADGYIFWYNQRWYDYTGTTFEQMKGWGWQDVHDPAELPRVLEKFKAHLAAGIPWEDTFPIRRHDGAMRWHLSRARPIRDKAGRVVRWFGTNTDITAQRELEQALRASVDRFRTLTEAVPQMVWTADAAGAVTFVNRRWEEYTGAPLAAAPGAAWGDLVHPDDAEQLRAGWQLAIANQPNWFTDEFRLRREADGAYRWMLSAAVPLRDSTGAVIEWVGSITDIDDQRRQTETLERMVRERTAELRAQVDERTRAEAEVREQQEFLDAILANVADGIVACDAAGNLTLFNRAAREFHGLPAESIGPAEWAGRYNLYRADGVTPLPTEEVPLYRALRGEEVRDAEMVIAPRRCPRRTLLASGQQLIDDAGQNLGAVVTMRNVTERKEAERRLRDANAELERSNGELEQFAYIASHDLQEPLRKIQAFGDRLLTKFRDELPDPGKEYVDRMQTSAGRMRRLIDDLLDYSRVTTSARPFVRVDLSRLVRESVSDLDERIESLGGRVEVGDLPTVEADPSQLRQLFQNLIANAVKFHRPNVPPVVEVRGELFSLHPGRDETPLPACRITIRDNGIGFDEKYLDRIFQVFQRLHGRDEYEGTGVGLAICRKIVERHRGTITAHSRTEAGATFEVVLPACHPREDAPIELRTDQETDHHPDGG